MTFFSSEVLELSLASPEGRALVLSRKDGLASMVLDLPTLEVEGESLALHASDFHPKGDLLLLPQGVHHSAFEAAVLGREGLSLELQVRAAPNSSVLRFRLLLHSPSPLRLTKTHGRDGLTLTSWTLPEGSKAVEVQLSQFNRLVHSFCLAEEEVHPSEFEGGSERMGPLLAVEGGQASCLLAYEHGSEAPDAFVAFRLSPGPRASLEAVKGSYCHGQEVRPGQPFETLWMEAALVPGGLDDLARAYRSFILHEISPNLASREPLIFYNTWAYQERVRWWQKRPYLADMNEARMLAEIEAAHKMGIEVFVIDTGWYEMTGDWQVSTERFPRGMAPIKARLDELGMKLGLWFNPTVAAVSSEMRARHEDCLMTTHGKPHDPQEVWETPESQGLCLVSRYGDAFAEELIRLHREVGVTYFKWDAIEQYSCDASGHGHGGLENTEEERRNSYAFQLGAAMARVVDKVCAACPEAIVDFDITEGGRTVGLQFLASGKYFLINNGPYNFDYNGPIPADGNVNLFFFPGPARGWICRTPLTYDKWIPTCLFLTHYLPDDRYRKFGWQGRVDEVDDPDSQWISLASLILGQNGIWGDLLAVTEEGVERMGAFLGLYKQIRGAMTEASLIRTGQVGGSPEIYEKIGPGGVGAVCLFASAPGVYRYATRADNLDPRLWKSEDLEVSLDGQGRARLTARFERAGARVVLFGVDQP